MTGNRNGLRFVVDTNATRDCMAGIQLSTVAGRYAGLVTRS